MKEKNMETKEPSMEEILSSIRRILSKEEISEPKENDVLPQTPSPKEDIIELTKEMMVDQVDNTVSEKMEDYALEPLISEDSAKAMAEPLSELNNVLSKDKALKQTSGVLLEDFVRSIMAPYLKEWLDANLPDLVERVVQREVRRVVDKSNI